jgi:hypothetical protein
VRVIRGFHSGWRGRSGLGCSGFWGLLAAQVCRLPVAEMVVWGLEKAFGVSYAGRVLRRLRIGTTLI